MKPHYISRKGLNNKSFTVTHHVMKSLIKLWHYHPEVELVYTVKSNGTLFTGDSFNNFSAGDIMLIGKNLPHMWINDDAYFKENSNLIAEDYVVHFQEDFLGDVFFKTNEMKSISILLKRAQQGIKFIDIQNSIGRQIERLNTLSDFERTMSLIRILHTLSTHDKYESLSSPSFGSINKQVNNDELKHVYEYIFDNFSKKLTLDEVAQRANMNTSAFSRLFKRINKKSFSVYLTELRIGYACKLLLEDDMNITTICFESGFNNVSNFNRHFKAKKNYSPTEYRKAFRSKVVV